MVIRLESLLERHNTEYNQYLGSVYVEQMLRPHTVRSCVCAEINNKLTQRLLWLSLSLEHNHTLLCPCREGRRPWVFINFRTASLIFYLYLSSSRPIHRWQLLSLPHFKTHTHTHTSVRVLPYQACPYSKNIVLIISIKTILSSFYGTKTAYYFLKKSMAHAFA